MPKMMQMSDREIEAFIESHEPTAKEVAAWDDGTHTVEEAFRNSAYSHLNTVTRRWKNANGELSRRGNNKPAEMGFYTNGRPYFVSFVKGGIAHRDAGPAYVEWDAEGNVVIMTFIQDGQERNLSVGPSYVRGLRRGDGLLVYQAFG